MQSVTRKALLALFIAALTAPVQADISKWSQSSFNTVQAINKMEASDAGRLRACGMMKMGGDGFIGRVGNMNYAIRCWSVGGQLASCAAMATQAVTFLDIERSGQATFSELTNKLENTTGASADATDGLSLAESAPKKMPLDQFGLEVYKQCSSYAEIR